MPVNVEVDVLLSVHGATVVGLARIVRETR